MARNPLVTAFGETKKASDWLKDYRCFAKSIESIYQRIFELEWDSNRAISEAPSREVKKTIPLKTGETFGYLTLTGNFKKDRGTKYAECKCVCGNIVFRRIRHIRSGLLLKRSCGCISVYEDHSLVTHGFSRSENGKKHPLYSIWCSMRDRCISESHENYNDYGGRGITIEFIDFFDFYDWAINNGWKKGLTIDRKEVNENYSRLNCRWITIQEQQRNKRLTILITAFGETKSIPDWVEDKRCFVTYNQFYKGVVIKKINPEIVILAKSWQEIRHL